jgi:hypothetical protein
MRSFILCSLICISINSFSQTIPSTPAAITTINTDYQVTLAGIGPFKINMAKAEIEKLLGKKIATPHNTNHDSYNNDTVAITYKDVNLNMVFYQEYLAENKTETALFSIYSNSPLLKTKSGIGIGDEKAKVLSTYDDYSLNIYFDFDDDGKGNYKKSKTNSSILLFGENSVSTLRFKMINKKITEFEVSIYEGD